MKKYIEWSKLHWNAIQFALIMFWFINVLGSSAYTVVYVLYFFVGVYALYQNQQSAVSFSGWKAVFAGCASGIFSISTVLSNYDIFEVYGILTNSVLLLGGALLCWNFLKYWYSTNVKDEKLRRNIPQGKSTKLFLAVFLGIVTINLSFLFFVEYPGTLTADSFSQIKQVVGIRNYSNWHPVCHTLLIKFFMDIGYALFNNYNDAVALYVVFQILFLAFTFSYAVSTLRAAGLSLKRVICVACIYMFAPYHIVYSVTVWKDVTFAGFVLLFITSLYALIMHVGHNRILHYVLFFIGCIGFGVMRSNGFYALVVAFLLCVIPCRKEWRILLLWFLGICVSWFLLSPLNTLLNVNKVDILESLSIPLQQVARVIAEHRDIYENEWGLIDTVISVEQVPDLYLPYLSDPIKDGIRLKNLDYFTGHLFDYLKLWVKLGLRYPMDYIHAWVDQTKGYWNAGYEYWVMTSVVHENVLDIYKTVELGPISQFFSNILYQTENMPVLHLLFSIGHHVWLIVLMFVCNFLLGKKEAVIAIPVIMIVGTLVIATPVFSEFRYAYSVFTTYPFILAISWPRTGLGQADGLKQ